MKFLRDYQQVNATKVAEVINKHNLVLIAGEVRTGKTATVLKAAELIGSKKILFVSKKKALSSINGDFCDFGFDFNMEMIAINYESLHKLEENDFDLVVLDESHTLGAFPKKSLRTTQLIDICKGKKVALMSGTLTPESYSQIYHQLCVSNFSPFKNYANFYKWANDYVEVKKVKRNSFFVNDYKNARINLIEKEIEHLIVSFTQKESGFKSKITEHVLNVKMKDSTYKLAKELENKLVVEGKNGVLLADTPVKLQSKLHQIFSGTVKLEDGNSVIIDNTKAKYIFEKFNFQKIAIFYKFKAEYKMLKEVFKDRICDDIDKFNSDSDMNIALQYQSGREGTNLSKADALVFLNIDFSSVSYWQARDRMTTFDREENNVYWVFSESGIEEKIYKLVLNKKDYTIYYFKKDYGKGFSSEGNQGPQSRRMVCNKTNTNQ